MRLIFLLFIVFLVFNNYAISQSAFGLKAGINLSNQHKTTSFPQSGSRHIQETKLLFGYQFGTFYKIHATSKWTIAAEASFSLIGSRNEYLTQEQILNPDGKKHYYGDKMGYVEIPLTVQYNFDNLYFGLGPGIAFKIFSKITDLEGHTHNGFNYRKFDVAGNFLLGYKISKKLDINLRYSHGVLNILEDRFNQVTKNRFFNSSLLYSFKHK